MNKNKMTRITAFAVTLVLVLAALLIPVVSASGTKRGDVNLDGNINYLDYITLRYHILSIQTLGSDGLANADANNDGSVNYLDYIALRYHILNIKSLDEYENGSGESSMNTENPEAILKVAYVPLDDRPVNVDRLVYLAQASGFELLMPDLDYYRTVLDGQPTNSNGTNYGNPKALVEWLREMDAEVDYFIISIDQMISGGLANSRYLSNTDLTAEYETLDFLIELAESNKVYFFDTVMRLASTVGYNGYGGTEYGLLRTYGAVARKTLEDTDLTVENIISGYKYGTNGSVIGSSLSDNDINKYLASRTRKLKVIDYLLRNCNDENTYCFVGVDDSSPQTTIQTNEINYIDGLLGDNGIIFAGADELGMMAMTRMSSEYYKSDFTVGIRYFGGGENLPADDFDIESLDGNLTKHLYSLDVNYTTGNTGDLQILVLTRVSNSSAAETAAAELTTALQYNLNNQIPTIILDCSQSYRWVLGYKLNTVSNLGLALGYSSWNTAGNSIGLAVGQGISRYLYLINNEASDYADEGFIKSITFSYCKDIGYRTSAIDSVQSSINSMFGNTSNFYPQIQSQAQETAANNILLTELTKSGSLGKAYLNALSGSKIISSLADGGYETATAGNISLVNARFPWYRTFEATFDIEIG